MSEIRLQIQKYVQSLETNYNDKIRDMQTKLVNQKLYYKKF